MTIGTKMQHPAIKAERPDPGHLAQNYYHQQQQQQLAQQGSLQQLQQQQRNNPQVNNTRGPNQVPQINGYKKTTAAAAGAPKLPDVDIEKQPDFQSIKGVFGWTLIDNVHIPYILRGNEQFVSVRIVEIKLLSRYPNSYPDDLGKQAPLTSFFITVNEAKLLNEINLQHCVGEYGKKEFTTKDLIVSLSDFINFFSLVKKTFPDAVIPHYQAPKDTAGWLQIKNTVTPYIRREYDKYVPLSVIQYAAGLLTNEKVSGLAPLKGECDLLNNACKTAGVEFVFSDATTRLINVKDILEISSVDIIELPSSNPLKHATYMELPTISNTQVSEKPKDAPGKSSGQPYLFQPVSQVDIARSHNQGIITRPNQHNTGMPVPPLTAYPESQMFDPRMIDPRMAEIYRRQYATSNRATIPDGTQNVRPGHVSHLQMQPNMIPLMQHYINMQNGQNARHQDPASKSGQLPVLSHHQHLNGPSSKSPEANSNPSPRPRPSSQSRPPSDPRQFTESPLGSPLSPCGPISSNFPSFHSGVSLQQMQTMYLQRFPPPNVAQSKSKSLVDPKHISFNTPKAPSEPKHQKKLVPNANQEIPGLFSPTGSSVLVPKHHEQLVSVSQTFGLPSTLQLVTSSNTLGVNSVTSISPSVSTVNMVEPVSQTLGPQGQASNSTAKLQNPVNSISGNWLNNKSISCLYLDQGEERKGPYCLVEAVCKLYFNGCSVNEFLFALENVLNVSLLTCNDSEEKAFIQYYNLPVLTLKCNKMVKFDDLEKYFPQLTYMFPSKEAISQTESDIVTSGLNEVLDEFTSGVHCPQALEASMPTTINEMISQKGKKRQSNSSQEIPLAKQPHLEGTEDIINNEDEAAVIILD